MRSLTRSPEARLEEGEAAAETSTDQLAADATPTPRIRTPCPSVRSASGRRYDPADADGHRRSAIHTSPGVPGTDAGKLLIGGEWVEPAAAAHSSIDPATGDGIYQVGQGDADDIAQAVAAAQAALDGPPRKVSPSKRSGLMYTLAELIKATARSSPSSSRSTTASRSRAPGSTSQPPSTTSATSRAGRPRSRAKRSPRRRATSSATRSASRWVSAARSSPGTTRS